MVIIRVLLNVPHCARPSSAPQQVSTRAARYGALAKTCVRTREPAACSDGPCTKAAGHCLVPPAAKRHQARFYTLLSHHEPLQVLLPASLAEIPDTPRGTTINSLGASSTSAAAPSLAP